MSWHYLLEQEEESSEDISWDGKQFVPSKSKTTLGEYCLLDSETESSRGSRSGMTLERLTGPSGEVELTLCLEDSRAKGSQRHTTGTRRQMTCHKTLPEWLKRCARRLFSQKMSQQEQLGSCPEDSVLWVILPRGCQYPRKTLVQTILGEDFGLCHTPTSTANFACPSMQKHKSCRNFLLMFGKPAPMSFEWMMGWPIEWTALKPLGMDKFQRWLRSHGRS